MAGLALLTVVLIAAITTRAFKRAKLAALVLLNIPFSLIGSIAAIDASGVGLTLGSIVGLVVVFGVAARNSIMLLAHTEHLVDIEGLPPGRSTLQRAASERLLPILMMALVAALGLIPLAFGLGTAGHEIEAPMAIAVLGGLASATLLNLLVVPEAAFRSALLAPHVSGEYASYAAAE